MLTCRVHALGTLCEYRYVVVLSRYQGQLFLSRHRARATWETQGGHIEPGETPLEAARRELYEESGAVRFRMKPVFDYWAGEEPDGPGASGVVFAAEIEELGPLPESEMAETACFNTLPLQLTYPWISPVLFSYAEKTAVWSRFCESSVDIDVM